MGGQQPPHLAGVFFRIERRPNLSYIGNISASAQVTPRATSFRLIQIQEIRLAPCRETIESFHLPL